MLNILAFALGIILLQQAAELPPSPLPIGLGALAVLAASGWLRASTGRAILQAFLALVLGVAWAGWRAEVRLAEALDPAWQGRDVVIVGVVASLPQDFDGGVRCEIDVEQVLTAGAGVPGHLALSWYSVPGGVAGGAADAALPRLRPGERWQWTIRLKRPHGNANPHGFDYEAWLLERGIRASGHVRPEGARRLAENVPGFSYAVERWRDRLREGFRQRLPAADYPLAGVLLALAMGDQKAISNELWAVFNRTGVTHLVSISGLHVTMVAALFGQLASALWRRQPALALRLPAQRAGLLAAALAAFAYTLLAGFAVPAQRTLYMVLAVTAATFAERRLAAGRTLALALLLVLLLDPWAVLAAGFWLSFGAVAALFLAGAARPAMAAGGWRERLALWGATQWTATLASLPILLLVFQQFSLVSPLANAVAVPLVSLVITPLALLGAFVPWWPLLHLAHALMSGLLSGLELLATWPVWQAPVPPLWAVLAAGLGVAVALLPAGLPGRWSGLFLLLPVLFWPAQRPPAGALELTVLDVGQGLASVLRTRDHTLIYDPGPLYSAESDAGQRIVVPFLRALGERRVDMLVVTHRDADHAGGTASVRAALPVGEIRSSMRLADARPCLAGEAWDWDGVHFEFLHPASDGLTATKANHLSCVLRVTAGGRRLLLTSDIEAPDEAALLARYPGDLGASVLLVPHHGSKTSSTPAFLAAVGAPEAIIPVGAFNRYGHPKAEVLARYEALGSRLWRTDRQGAVRLLMASDGIRLSAWRDERRRYWDGR